MTHNAQSSTQPKRRRDLDVIGILVVGGLIFLHTAQIFAPVIFYIKNAPSNFEEPSQLVALTFMAFFTLWGMPLMFFIAGMAVWYSLRKRTAGVFVRERVRRLLGQVADTGANLDAVFDDVQTKHRPTAGCWPDQTEEEFHSGRLAGAIGTEKAKYRILRVCQGELLDSFNFIEGLDRDVI